MLKLADLSPDLNKGHLYRPLVRLLLLLVVWFSCQPPVTPALAAMVPCPSVSGGATQGQQQVPEDNSNSSVREHLVAIRRTDRQAPRFTLIPASFPSASALVHAVATGDQENYRSGSDLWLLHCIMRT